ncbi:MAG TPA: ATP-binding cassette domain-containing protein [Candidatus Thermoplasmatota archaeon]|nr:ATP-binding cassette domain-containing protein [Candidatus Thermoplasmatota archaeon]
MPEPPPAALAAQAALAEVRGFRAPGGFLDVVVRPGDVVLLRGPNGSGKTSLLRLLAGLPAPLLATSCRVLGADPAMRPARGLQAHLVTQDPRDGLVGLTVRGEAALRGWRPLHPPGPTPSAGPGPDQPVATLSSGEARRLALAVASATPRPLLLLDEPAEGLDAAGRRMLEGLVRDHARRGAVVLTDHSGFAAGLATRTVDLDPRPGGHRPALPRGAGQAVLRVPPCQPPFLPSPFAGCELGPGLHALAGPNGSGKSSLLRGIATLAPGCAATIHGWPVRPGSNLRLLLPHARELLRHESVRQELDAVVSRASGLAGRRTTDQLTAGLAVAGHIPVSPTIETLAATWGLEGLLERHPLSLSGGEAQRLALAKSLVPAAVHLLDEPEAHLDAQGRGLLWEALARSLAEGACILLASHDPELLAAAHTRLDLVPR